MTRPVPGVQIVGRGSLAALPSPPLPSQAFFPGAAANYLNAWSMTILSQLPAVFRGQFNKTFANVIYKGSCCFQALKQWLHL